MKYFDKILLQFCTELQEVTIEAKKMALDAKEEAKAAVVRAEEAAKAAAEKVTELASLFLSYRDVNYFLLCGILHNINYQHIQLGTLK